MLKRRAFDATLWSAADVLIRQCLQFAVTIALTRLLTPTDFGTFGLILLFTGLATVFVDGGFSAALIQRQDISQTDESTVFWFNLLAGVAAAAVLYAAAPAIAGFYARPVLVPLLALMAVNVLLGALGAIHASLLSKQLDFRTQTKVGFTATCASGAISVWMAWKGYGIWALAVQVVLSTSISTVLFWSISRWRPTLEFSRGSARKLFGFGGYHFASILMDMIFSRFYTVLIGKFSGVRALGYYSNADNTQQMPSGVLVKVLSRVAFPMFASASHDPAALRRGMQLGIRGSMLLNVPMMLGMAAVAEPLVRVLFGAQWLPAVPILRVLCLSGVLLPVHVLNLNCLMAQGHSRLMFRVELAKKLIGVVALGAGAHYGVIGIAWAMAGFSVIGLAINAFYAQRLLGYGVLAQVREFMPVLAAGIVMAVAVAVLAEHWGAPPLMKLAGLVATGVIVFLAIMLAVRMDAWRDVAALFGRGSTAPPAHAQLP